jgi:hypothetical protein
MEITLGQKISDIITAFETYALGDIKNVKKHKMPIAAFILGVCFIDQVSGFIYDKRKPGQKSNSDRSKKFVSEYLNKVSIKPYDKDDLIELLRNKLVHNYSVTDNKTPKRQKYVLGYDEPRLHLHKEGDVIVINIEGFITDLENAFKLYKGQLLSDPGSQSIAISHYNDHGILVHKKLELQTGTGDKPL